MSDNNQPEKTCTNCPSFLTAEQAPDKFRRSIGSAICGRYGTPLGRPGNSIRQDAAIRKQMANQCPSYGEPMPGSPQYQHNVMLGMPELRDATNIDPDKSFINNCRQCKNFIDESVVATELGWTAGLCAARGTLLLGHRLSTEAAGCEFRQFGQTRGTTSGMHFLPEFQEALTVGGIDPISAFMKNKGNFIDPVDYPSDKEVTEEEVKFGIRAWRKIVDPKGSGNEVYLPIYNLDFFSEDERVLIPRTGDEEHPELYIDHFGGVYGLTVAWLELDETPTLWGQSGTGKTELFRHMAWLMCLPFRRVSVTADSQIEDVAGSKEYSPELGTYFSYGEVPKAWTKPGILCLDEPNVAKDPAVWHFIRPLTDNSKQLILTMNNNERLKRCDDCYMGLAMNPAWDPRNIGALEIADADANRLYHEWVPLPPEPLEREMIQARVKLDGWELSLEQLNSVMATAKGLRDIAAEDVLPITWAIRPQIKVARALRWFGVIDAYNKAVGNFLDEEQREALLDVVRANWKEVD